MNFNFEDFIPVYPLQDDPDIQYKIGIKQEFLEVKGQVSEPPPSLGNLYKHQEAFKRYMTHYDRMLNIHNVGTGKTCALVAVVEYMKKNPEFKKAYILEKGDSTKNEFKNQIAMKCTNNVYITDKYREAKDEVTRRGALTRAIRETYEIMSYGDLANEVKRLGDSPEEIEKHYSGCIFIVDEAHNLNETAMKKVNPETNDEVDADPEVAQKDPKDTYKRLWKLFHNIKRSKVILATATPMINSVNEIANIMNLILPADMQMPTDWDYNKTTLQQLEPFFRGRVSYVRSLDTGAIEEYQGEFMNRVFKLEFADENQSVPFMATVRNNKYEEISVPEMPKVKTTMRSFESQTVVYPLIMNEFQSEAYLKSVKDDSKKKTKSTAFRRNERDASCLVFPDGSYGGNFDKGESARAGKYIEAIRKGKYKITPEFKKFIKTPGNLGKLSAKYNFILSKEIDAAKRRQRGEIVGNAFCYSDMKTGSGIIILSKIMEEIGGFEKYEESGSVFVKDKFGQSVIRKDFEKKLRYGIITSGMENSEITSLLELFNSKENANGDYCQVILGSESSRDGINIYNALRGYLINAGWNPSGTLQALARIMRATSHEYILELIRNKSIQEGKVIENKVKVEIYKLATVVDENDLDKTMVVTENTNFENEKSNSVDFDLYSLSERKDIGIRRMMKFLKQCAVDCSINYSRNVRAGDIDGSAKCDYGECNYVCYTSGITDKVPNNEIDYSTYEILYSDKIVEQCRNDIINILSKKNMISISKLYNDSELNFYKPLFINMAIDSIIKDKIKIKNRFGFPAFINTDGNNIFTQTELPTYNLTLSTNIASISLYKDMLFSFYKNKIDDIITELSHEDDDYLLDKIINMGNITSSNYEEFSNTFDKLGNTIKNKIIEEIIKYKLYKNSQIKECNSLFLCGKEINENIIESILEKLKNFIYAFHEPTTDIKSIKRYLETSTDRRGRARKQKSCPIIPNINLKGEDLNSEIVYLHSYSGIKQDITSFKVNTQFLNPSEDIRIFKPSENEGWRNIYDYECQAYKNLILKYNQSKLEKYKKFKTFGTIAQDKKFRIIESKELNFESTDQRSVPKGTVCKSFKNKFDLVEILLESDEMPDYIRTLDLPYETKDELIDYLIKVEKVDKTKDELNLYLFDDLNFIAKWFSAKRVSKDDICDYIEKLFEKEDRILNV